MSHQLIVLPDDTPKPIVDAVKGAKKSLNVRMFLFSDLTLLDAVLGAKKQGVNVRVMLNPARRSEAAAAMGKTMPSRPSCLPALMTVS